MTERGPFTVRRSQLYLECFFISARHDDIKDKNDERKYGYIVLIEDQAKTLAYCLNKQHDDEQLLRNLKDNLGRLLGNRYL